LANYLALGGTLLLGYLSSWWKISCSRKE
jgi:hypothetical protein